MSPTRPCNINLNLSSLKRRPTSTCFKCVYCPHIGLNATITGRRSPVTGRKGYSLSPTTSGYRPSARKSLRWWPGRSCPRCRRRRSTRSRETSQLRCSGPWERKRWSGARLRENISRKTFRELICGKKKSGKEEKGRIKYNRDTEKRSNKETCWGQIVILVYIIFCLFLFNLVLCLCGS